MNGSLKIFALQTGISKQIDVLFFSFDVKGVYLQNYEDLVVEDYTKGLISKSEAKKERENNYVGYPPPPPPVLGRPSGSLPVNRSRGQLIMFIVIIYCGRI